MRRRDFMAGLGSAVAWPVVARAQQRVPPAIGYLGGSSPSADSFFRGLGELGFVEGLNVQILYRAAQFQYDRLDALATDLVNRRVAVIYARGSTQALAAKRATATIPIVFSTGGDPVEDGLAQRRTVGQPGLYARVRR